MITRDFGDGGWAAGCEGAPPPLHVHDTESDAARWFPLPRIVAFPQHPGPEIIHIPVPAPYGDDPLDRAMQTVPRAQSAGMIGRALTLQAAPRPGAEGRRG